MASKLNKNLNNILKVINDIDKNEHHDKNVTNEKNVINERGTSTEDANLSHNNNNVIYYNHDKNDQDMSEQKLDTLYRKDFS